MAGRRALGWSLLVLLAACKPAPPAPPHPAVEALPARMVWAWERAEDLRWLPPEVGVAYVTTAIGLKGESVSVRPRTSAMRVNPGTVLVPVVHVDLSWRFPPALNTKQRTAVIDQVLRAARETRHNVVQLDLEARLSQRAFLQDLVRELRQRLPRGTALSMTALASWCADDYWLGAMQADEIVPMAFRMGRDSPLLRERLARTGRFAQAKCDRALGQATDELLPGAGAGAVRQYYFSPKAWTSANWQRLADPTSPL